MEDLESTFDRIIEETYQHYKIVREEINKAAQDGRTIANVISDKSTRRGDIITISHFSEDGTIDEDVEEFTARVLGTSPRTGRDENGNTIQCVDALCVILKPGDIESLDDFAAMYGNEEDSDEEELEAEDSDSTEERSENEDTCPCGANLQMCETNQKVFGGHLND